MPRIVVCRVCGDAHWEDRPCPGCSPTNQQENAMPTPIMKYFAYEHLPEHLREVSKPVADLAVEMDKTLPNGPEKSAGLRKLLEAKDCFVRSALGDAD